MASTVLGLDFPLKSLPDIPLSVIKIIFFKDTNACMIIIVDGIKMQCMNNALSFETGGGTKRSLEVGHEWLFWYDD